MEEQTHVRLTLEPLDDYLIVEPVDEDVETRTGLIIPQSAEAEARSGVVTAVGLEAQGTSLATRCSSRRTQASMSGSAASPSRYCAAPS